MTYIIKNHTLPGSPFLADYQCEACGPFELLTERGADGDPPDKATCECGATAPRVITGTKIAFWTRTPVAINPPGATRHDTPDPRALDTRDLAEGKVTKAEWRKKQLEITKARRHAKRVKAGRVQKRIQVDSAGVK
jgi:hypothetical protein